MINKAKKIIKHPLFSGGIVMIAGSMGANVINYVYHVIFGRFLGPVDYGTLAAIYSILYVVTIVPISVSNSVVKFISSANSTSEIAKIYHTVNKLVLRISLFLGVGWVIISPFVSKFLNISDTALIIMVSPIMCFSLLALVNQSTLQGLLQFKKTVIINIVSSVAKLVFGLLLAYVGFRVHGAVVGIIISTVITYFYSQHLINSIISKSEADYSEIKAVLKYSLPLLVQALAFTGFITFDVIMVKHYLSPHDAGIYAALSTLGKMIFFATQPISAVSFPAISGRKARGEKYAHIFVISLVSTAIVSFVAVAVFYILPEFSVRLLYGEKYLSAAPYLFKMGMFIGLYTIAYSIVNYLLSVNKTQVVIIPAVLSLLQVTLIWLYHDSLDTIISLNLLIVGALVVLTGLYLIYTDFKILYEKQSIN